MAKKTAAAKGPIDLRTSLDKEISSYIKKKYPGESWTGTIYWAIARATCENLLVEYLSRTNNGWPEPAKVAAATMVEAQMDKKGALEWGKEQGGWEGLTARVAADLKERELALSGDSAMLLGAYMAVREASETDRWQGTSLKQDVTFLAMHHSVKTGERREVNPGSDTLEMVDLFARWLSQNASLKGLTPAASKGLTTPIASLILKHTLAAGAPAASRDLYALLDGDSAMSLWKNPRFNENTFRGIAHHKVADILSLGTGSLGSHPWEGPFFKTAARRGWRIQSHHVASLARLSRNCNALPTGAPWGDMVSLFPDAVMDEQIRKDLLVSPNGLRLPGMLAGSKGKAWAEVLARAVEVGGDKQWDSMVAQEVDKTDDWSLEGVTMAEILPLLSSTNSSLREAGIRVSSKIKQAAERAGATPETGGGAGRRI